VRGVRPRQSSRSTFVDDPSEQRIARLEAQVDALKRAVRELADALHEELTSVDGRLGALDIQHEEMAKVQASQGRAIRRQEERLKRGFTAMSDALSALTMNTASDQQSREFL